MNPQTSLLGRWYIVMIWQIRKWKLGVWEVTCSGSLCNKLVEQEFKPQVNSETACFSPNFHYTILHRFKGGKQVREGEDNFLVNPEWLKKAQKSPGNEDWVVLSGMCGALEKQPSIDYSGPYCGGIPNCLSTDYISRGHKKNSRLEWFLPPGNMENLSESTPAFQAESCFRKNMDRLERV